MKIHQLTIKEIIQLINNQFESVEERYKYKKEFKELYKLSKKPILKKIKDKFIICLTIIKKFWKKIRNHE